ncbi:MAG: regulatory protein TetR [Ilumatobacteraceae bacterium]|nr:regulatory protein TetR [Ilumatobacteraceae bacterium]MCU1388923.1 regulatory protein TetR [Ilumatobacteraceae bacterium]
MDGNAERSLSDAVRLLSIAIAELSTRLLDVRQCPEMTSTRRLGTDDSKTRTALLDAALQLMLEDGYAGVTSRRVAAKAGLKPQLVHYYFRTMDDLFLAMFRRGADWNLERQTLALASDQPLRALWDFSSEPAGATLTIEFSALANHRPAIRSVVLDYAERFRQLQIAALSSVLSDYGIDVDAYEPAALVLILQSIARFMVIEDALGVTTGHEETLALVARLLHRFEGDQP